MKTIKIPRITEGFTYPVQIFKGKCWNRTLILRKQTIEGVPVPKNSILYLDHSWDFQTNHTGDIAEVSIECVNKLIRYLYLETLRNQS